MPLENKINIFTPPCNILYIYTYHLKLSEGQSHLKVSLVWKLTSESQSFMSFLNVILSGSLRHTLTTNSHADLNKAFHTWPNINFVESQPSNTVSLYPGNFPPLVKLEKGKLLLSMTGWVNYLLWVWIPLHVLLWRSFKIVKGCDELQIYRK